MVSCHDDEEPKIKASRTVLMYLVADNSISDDIYPNIASVEEGLKNAETPGTFVIYWDGGKYYRSEFPQPTLFKYEVGEDGKVSDRVIIQTYNEQNSLSQDVMLDVFKDVEELCPAECYGLIFGSHATGWLPVDHSRTRSFGDDGGLKIDIPDLADVLARTSIHFDYILMDACLMSQVEVAYELRHSADYLILSPAEVMSTGFPYKNIVKYLLSVDDKERNAVLLAQAYLDYYKTQRFPWATIAVVKTDEMELLAAVTRSIMQENMENIASFTPSMLSLFQNRYGYGRGELSRSSYDFRAFVSEVTGGNIPLAFEGQLGKTVIFEGYVNDYPLVNIDEDMYSGIGCYIPYKSFTKWNAYLRIYSGILLWAGILLKSYWNKYTMENTSNLIPPTPKQKYVRGWLSFFLFVVGFGSLFSLIMSIVGFSSVDNVGFITCLFSGIDILFSLGLVALAGYTIYAFCIFGLMPFFSESYMLSLFLFPICWFCCPVKCRIQGGIAFHRW